MLVQGITLWSVKILGCTRDHGFYVDDSGNQIGLIFRVRDLVWRRIDKYGIWKSCNFCLRIETFGVGRLLKFR